MCKRVVRIKGVPFKIEDLRFAEYRKKPVTIKAVQIFSEFTVKTLEGTMKGNKGDWLIIGIKGELYPCKPDIFIATYEPVSNISKEEARSP